MPITRLDIANNSLEKTCAACRKTETFAVSDLRLSQPFGSTPTINFPPCSGGCGGRETLLVTTDTVAEDQAQTHHAWHRRAVNTLAQHLFETTPHEGVSAFAATDTLVRPRELLTLPFPQSLAPSLANTAPSARCRMPAWRRKLR